MEDYCKGKPSCFLSKVDSMLALFGRRLPSSGDRGHLQQPLQSDKEVRLGTLLYRLALLG